MSFLNLLNQTCSIERKVVTTSPSGEESESYQQVATGVSCSIQPDRGSIRAREYGEEITSIMRGFVPIDTDVRQDDHLIHNEDRYLVVFAGKWPGHHIELDLTTDV